MSLNTITMENARTMYSAEVYISPIAYFNPPPNCILHDEWRNSLILWLIVTFRRRLSAGVFSSGCINDILSACRFIGYVWMQLFSRVHSLFFKVNGCILINCNCAINTYVSKMNVTCCINLRKCCLCIRVVTKYFRL